MFRLADLARAVPLLTRFNARAALYSTTTTAAPTTATAEEPVSYSHTVHLPKSSLQLKASKSVEERYRVRTTSELYRHQRVDRDPLTSSAAGRPPAKSWVLHDGPPYANGPVHMGHLLNKVTKDVYNRYRLLRGDRVHYVPGWDCHGLPIELKSQEGKSKEELAALAPAQLRRLARRVAEKAMAVQQAAFERWAVMADWSDPSNGTYRTMDPLYEAQQLRVFWRMFQNGLIYRGVKPVYWSPSTRTALAEAELEYRERVSPAVYVRFAAEQPCDPDVLVWTTTPWTLLANRAVAVHPDLEYVVVRVAGGPQSGRRVLVAASRVEALQAEGVLVENDHCQREEEAAAAAAAAAADSRSMQRGSELVGRRFKHPLLESTTVPVIAGTHVTDESGTGLVHTAPGHGHDDWQASRRVGIEVFDCLTDDGRFNAATGPNYEGLDAYSETNEGSNKVIEELRARDALFSGPAKYSHRYPYDWRSGKPVVIRATAQWFANLDQSVRDMALRVISNDDDDNDDDNKNADGNGNNNNNNNNSNYNNGKDATMTVRMLPDGGRVRLQSMLASRSDWCISRQRVWGVPLPVFYHPVTDAPLIDEHSIQHICELVAKHGTDCWFWMPVEQLVPPQWLTNGTLDGIAHPSELKRCTDTMDVWFDSGSSWAHVLSDCGGVADLVFEGSDQHRGWFQSLLLTHVGAQKAAAAPYRTVITHGFVLDDKGRKMSKSLGNVIDPEQLAKDVSIDGLRLWVASNKLSNADVLASKESIDKSTQLLKRIRNTLKFLLGNQPAHVDHSIRPAHEFQPIDRVFLHQLASFSSKATAAYDSYNLGQLVQLVAQFIPNTASQYFESIKDRLYCDPIDAQRRIDCVYALSHLLTALLRAIGPILPYTVEEIHAEHRHGSEDNISAFASLGWFDGEYDVWHQPELQSAWDRLSDLRSHSNRQFEHNPNFRLVRSRLHFVVAPAATDVLAALEYLGPAGLVDLFGCAEVTFVVADGQAIPADEHTLQSSFGTDNQVSLIIHDLQETHTKCPRCWRYTVVPICQRCSDVLASLPQANGQ